MSHLTSFLDGDAPDAPARIRTIAGAALGSIFIVFLPVLLLLWASGGPEYVTRDGLRIRVDLLSLLYPLGAVLTGALFFLFAGFVQARVSKALMGAIAFGPWMAGIALCIDRGYAHWTAGHSAVALMAAAIFGATFGWNASRLTTRKRQSASARSAV